MFAVAEEMFSRPEEEEKDRIVLMFVLKVIVKLFYNVTTQSYPQSFWDGKRSWKGNGEGAVERPSTVMAFNSCQKLHQGPKANKPSAEVN